MATAAEVNANRSAFEALEIRRLRDIRDGWLTLSRQRKAAGDAGMVPHYVKAAFRVHDDLMFWGRLWGILPV